MKECENRKDLGVVRVRHEEGIRKKEVEESGKVREKKMVRVK